MRDDPIRFPPAIRSTWDWRLAFEAFLGLLLIVAALSTVVPKFGEIYRQVKIALPTRTAVLLDLSRDLTEEIWLVAFAVLAFTLEVGAWRGRKAAITRILIPVGTALVLGWMAFALFEPMLSVSGAIGSRRH